MSIVLFALIGAKINAGVAYWILFSLYCVIQVAAAVRDAANK